MIPQHKLNEITIGATSGVKFDDFQMTYNRVLMMALKPMHPVSIRMMELIQSGYDFPQISSEIRIDKLRINGLLTQQEFWMNVAGFCVVINMFKTDQRIIDSTRNFIYNHIKLIHQHVNTKEGKDFVIQLCRIVATTERHVENDHVTFIREKKNHPKPKNHHPTVMMCQGAVFWKAMLFVTVVLSAIESNK